MKKRTSIIWAILALAIMFSSASAVFTVSAEEINNTQITGEIAAFDGNTVFYNLRLNGDNGVSYLQYNINIENGTLISTQLLDFDGHMSGKREIFYASHNVEGLFANLKIEATDRTKPVTVTLTNISANNYNEEDVAVTASLQPIELSAKSENGVTQPAEKNDTEKGNGGYADIQNNQSSTPGNNENAEELQPLLNVLFVTVGVCSFAIVATFIITGRKRGTPQ